MLGFCLLAPLGDSLAKLLSGEIPLLELLLARFAVQALLLPPLVYAQGSAIVLSPRLRWLTLLRTLLHLAGSACMYLALRYLPVADAIAIAYVMPFLLLVLGKYLLQEAVGKSRLLACIVGFFGTLLVIQPNFAAIGLPALLPLAVAVIFAFYMLVTRQIAKALDPVVQQAASGLIAVPILLLVFLLGGDQPDLQLVWPAPHIAALLLSIGVIGTLAHLLMTWSLRLAPTATLAPMQYLEIPAATLFGWLIFRDLPNGIAAIGIAVTMAAGLYIILREQKIAPGAPPLA